MVDESPRRSSGRRDRRGPTKERKNSYDRIVPTVVEPRERDSSRSKTIPPLQSHRTAPPKVSPHHPSPPMRSQTDFIPRVVPSEPIHPHLGRSSTMPAATHVPNTRPSKGSRLKSEVYDSAYASAEYSSGD